MISISPRAGFEKQTFPESFKSKDPKYNKSTTTPEQQKTPKASPVMDKAGIQQQQDKKSSKEKNLNNILGSSFESWPYTEASLIHAINLKSEQEKTKQEYYRLESVARSLELMKHLILAQVPPNLIPIIFSGQNMSSEAVDLLVKNNTNLPLSLQQQQRTPSQFQSPQRPVPTNNRSLHESNPFRNNHERSQTISTPSDLRKQLYQQQQQQQLKAEEFSTPPMPTSFKFGGASSEAATPSSSRQNPPLAPAQFSPIRSPIHQRQLSPAKIGAQAVASLNSRFRNISSSLGSRHGRTTSLPPKVSIPEASAVTFHKEEKKTPNLPAVTTPTPTAYNKPVILQHQLIQFHHWTPSEADTTPNKRRRSDESGDEKSMNELRDDNTLERRKFITTHSRTRSDTSLMYTTDDKSKDLKSTPTKYPNILSDEN